MTSGNFPTLLTDLTARFPPSVLPFISLSYPVNTSLLSRLSPSPTAQLYDKGPKDLYFVCFCVIALTVAREVALRYFFAVFARWWLDRSVVPNGKVEGRAERRLRRKREHAVTRFAEEAWRFVYCTVVWCTGAYILCSYPNPASPEQLWGTYPVRYIPTITKVYYLGQLGWWFNQIYVTNTEKRRSDHWQMIGHHLLSITLVFGSYAANLTRVGVLIHVLMDFCDIFLSLAKMFRYLGLTTACDTTFVLFLIGWLLTRQIGLFLVIRSSYMEAPKFVPSIWNPSKGLLFTRTTRFGFNVMLVTLWGMASAWFYMACMVAVRVVRGLGAEDSRSDDEDDGSEEALDDVPHMKGSSGEAGCAMNGHGHLRKRNSH